MPKTKGPEMEQFEKDLLQSIGEMKRGQHAAVPPAPATTTYDRAPITLSSGGSHGQ
ncbi:hypothetical protein AB4Z46_25530 [Variovorax sp. M-6]|uniref:hypothetical protein n=1 Tax=Variovorax sp. M-6 TaxID=3233041 RepID=UPI003F959CD0